MSLNKVVGLKLALLNGLLRCVRSKKTPLPASYRRRILSKVSSIKTELISAVLASDLAETLRRVQRESSDSLAPIRHPDAAAGGSSTIWVPWFQGEENAPELVKSCINSIRAHAGGRRVVVVTEANCRDFVRLPDYVIDKFKSGVISKTHFSDILRACLLYEHGGLWADATVYLTKDIPARFFEDRICTLRADRQIDPDSITRAQWTGYFLSGPPHYPLFDFLRESFFLYWKESNEVIDYFLIDYLIRLAYDRIPKIRGDLESVPTMGNRRFLLASVLNCAFDEGISRELEQDPIGIYKLSLKQTYRAEQNGRETYFKRYIK